ncbi:MAG: hypothetical protein BA874_04845 [Desulfuromonadales bacterium C00003068]|nr:MAG: hypothetical protein BA874_04845 [Desulfuromonadales bacterium C00003068]
MNERVLIIVGIIAQYFMNEHDFSNEREIVEELLGAGFEEKEINEAFTWMETITLSTSPVLLKQLRPPQLRVFSPLEQKKLSIEAQGFLTGLRMKGILPSDIEEEIIIRACQDDEGQNSLEEIKSITILSLFASIQHDHFREIDCIFEDKLDKLYH